MPDSYSLLLIILHLVSAWLLNIINQEHRHFPSSQSLEKLGTSSRTVSATALQSLLLPLERSNLLRSIPGTDFLMQVFTVRERISEEGEGVCQD